MLIAFHKCFWLPHKPSFHFQTTLNTVSHPLQNPKINTIRSLELSIILTKLVLFYYSYVTLFKYTTFHWFFTAQKEIRDLRSENMSFLMYYN